VDAHDTGTAAQPDPVVCPGLISRFPSLLAWFAKPTAGLFFVKAPLRCSLDHRPALLTVIMNKWPDLFAFATVTFVFKLAKDAHL